MSNEPSTSEPGDKSDKSDIPRLSPEEAKAVLRAISDVEREEAAREEAEPASDEPSNSDTP